MEPVELVKRYLSQTNVMQLATSDNGQPWACTVHYYSDDDFNFYWISLLSRKHSLDIKQNNKVAAAVLFHENTSAEPYVIGISLEGTAELIGDQIDEKTSVAYIKKLAKDPSLLTNIATGKNQHKFYRLKPSKIILFDSKNFPDDPRQEVVL